MYKINNYILLDKLNFCKSILSNFTELRTPIAVIIYIQYFAQYLLLKYSKGMGNGTDSYIGASIVLEKSGAQLFHSMVKARNALINCDKEDSLKHIRVLREQDYCDYPDYCDVDIETNNFYTVFLTVNWEDVVDYVKSL